MLASRTITTRQSKKKQTVDETKNMLIGFISWNIQNNINQSKMDELIQKYLYNVELEPDIIVVALQEVPVDIAITKTRKSFKEKFYKKIGDMLSNSLKSYTIIDSYDKPSNSFFTSTNTKQKNLNLFTCANIVSGVAGGYGIVTYIFKREHLTIPIIPTAVKERCIDQTKGYCVVTLQIGDNQSIDIVNTHMPFRDEKTTSSFTNEMLRWLRVHNFRSDAQVVLGDLNSRSLLTPECYAKNITTCEGGMVVTNNEKYYNRMKVFLTHGITRDYKDREKSDISHYYEMVSLGYNYRIPDILCALGINQLKKLDHFISRRQEIAKIYDNNLDKLN